jgi:predicted metalloprotease with PDZ domain
LKSWINLHFFLAERLNRAHRIGFFIIFLGGMFSSPGLVLAADEVRHTLSYPQDRQQIVLVRSEFPVTAGVTELVMPNWTPGSYRIRHYAANVDSLTVALGNGTALPVQKISKDRWSVRTDQAGTLVALYEVFTPDLNVSNSWVSDAFSLINGASVFLYTQQSRDLPQRVVVVADSDRGQVFTAMPLSGGTTTYLAANYDELVDSPVVVANAPSYPFLHKRQEYFLLNVGENEFWDGSKAARDVEKIVVETQSFWRTNPLSKPYWFLNFAVEGKGGLEHDHSTVIMTGRRQMGDRDTYIQWLGVVAHEFFHVWNVRHMRPQELAPYDYQYEQYTSQLWLAEGLTSYYDNLLMSRAGLITPMEYMELLAKDIHRLETTPGRLLRPVTEASIDAWIRHYRPNSNSVNSTISYYTKGAVISFVLDAYLRKKSKGRHDLDEVMRKMYSLFSDRPYDSDAFEKVLIDVGGAGAGEILQSLLTTTVDPDVDAALDWYGLELIRGSVAENGEVVESGFGVVWDEGKAGMVVKTVLAGSGGSVAGLMSGDEILAIGGERLTKDTLTSLMVSYRPGDNTILLLSRRGKIISLDIKLDAAIPDRFDIALRSGFGKRHINRLQSLLGQKLRGRP